MSNGKKSVLLIVAVILIDQISKVWIKTNFMIGDSIKITDWFYIYFIENNGMAFGMEFFNKIFLTFFRIVAVGIVGYLMHYCLKHKYPLGFMMCLSLIFAGASGNLIDCIFYGVIFGDSHGQIATVFSGGYAPIFQGKVVDMLYLPIIDTNLPDWIPFWGGDEFVFFSPIFNIADSAITIGVIAILLFYSKYLSNIEYKNEKVEIVEIE
jgi:signal peptidase II